MFGVADLLGSIRNPTEADADADEESDKSDEEDEEVEDEEHSDHEGSLENDGDREKDREKSKEKEKDKEKDKDRSKDKKERAKSRDKDKNREDGSGEEDHSGQEKEPADSDDEYDKRKSAKNRDKFRGERSEYDSKDKKETNNREEKRGTNNSGSREYVDNRENDDRKRRRYDTGDYNNRNNRRDRYSPQRTSPTAKRSRRDWESTENNNYGNTSNYDNNTNDRNSNQYSWNNGNTHSSSDQPQTNSAYGSTKPTMDGEIITQPAMNSFKLFLSTQDDNITDEESIKKYNEYKLEFKKQQINEFFLAHKEEEWFRSKYHPEECEKRDTNAKASLFLRKNTFLRLISLGYMDDVTCDLDKDEQLTRMLNAAVIMLEGGTDFDLQSLDLPEDSNDEVNKSSTETELSKSDKPDQKEPEIFVCTEKKKKEKEKEPVKEPEKDPETPLEMPMTEEGEELKRKAEEFVKNKEADGSDNEDKDDKTKGKKRRRRKREYSYSGSNSSDSGSQSEHEKSQDEDEPPPPGIDPKESLKKQEEGECAEEPEEKEESNMETEPLPEEEPKPKALHRTYSIFLRNLAPSITKQEVEAMCKRYPGFLRVALQDPQPERRFFRRGWVTFDRTVNIKDICWNINNIRLKDCEMGAIVNRDLKQRVRPVDPRTSHRIVMKNDIKHAAKICMIFDERTKVWEDEEKQDNEKDTMSFGLISKNPVLKNITSFLVEEGDYEEEELLGVSLDDKPKDLNADVPFETDAELIKVLDRIIFYMRIVHSFDYLGAVEYPNEDEMPHKSGMIHVRGSPQECAFKLREMNDWNEKFEIKLAPFMLEHTTLTDEGIQQLGKKDPEIEVEKFVSANTQELGKEKWLCPLSGKKFKAPEFVRKHIFNKHVEKVEEVKLEVTFFNNYLADPKRPQLPEHPGFKNLPGRNQALHHDTNNYSNYGGGGGQQYSNYRGNNSMGGATGYRGYQRNDDRRGGRGRGDYSSYNSYNTGYNRGGRNYGSSPRDREYHRFPRRDRGRMDPRNIIEYRDLDAPDDFDIF